MSRSSFLLTVRTRLRLIRREQAPVQTTTNAYNVTDVSGSVTINGSAFALTTTVPGQNANITFSGTASQLATVRIANSTFSCVTVTLLKPDGTSLTSTFTCSGTFNLSQQTLPTTGTYTIKVDPNGARIGTQMSV